MNEILQKAISIVVTFVMFIYSYIWIYRNPAEIEPLISTMGLGLTLILQLFGWRPKGKIYLLYDAPDYVTQAVPRLFDFSKDQCRILIKAENTRREYWRIGLKMRKLPNVHIHPHLETGYLLFSIEQTDDQIRLALHGEDGLPIFNNHTVITNFDNDTEILLKVSKDFGHIKFEISSDGQLLEAVSVSSDYRYARLISWGDNKFYKLSIEIKNWFYLFYV
ncbi:hypothetical protein [Chitinophaga tropicalis]|uniref:Uncharacterized protein n=1 Tax=Chitinophaga tropicalis TaxID=2683588 RepID=A0A7K1U0D9_9BACT|nr:hypothetical protein [Chitinophaga tropicalis]MVT07813.1 hypothetical protein [Chitinophaga tropicalis]